MSAPDLLQEGQFAQHRPIQGWKRHVYIPPERVQAIENAMPRVYVGSSQKEAPAHLPTSAGNKLAWQAMLVRKRIATDIMQSDVPPGHLGHGLFAFRTGQKLSPGTHAQYNAAVEAPTGWIDTRDRYDAKKPSTRAQRESRRRTLVHEIGHHQDPMTHNPYHRIGQTEANAENYADQYLGRTKTAVPVNYDDPENMALSYGQKATYAKFRHKPRSNQIPIK